MSQCEGMSNCWARLCHMFQNCKMEYSVIGLCKHRIRMGPNEKCLIQNEFIRLIVNDFIICMNVVIKIKIKNMPNMSLETRVYSCGFSIREEIHPGLLLTYCIIRLVKHHYPIKGGI